MFSKYRTPDDLVPAEEAMVVLSRAIWLGYQSGNVNDDHIQYRRNSAAALLDEARSRLLSAGRLADLQAFAKHLYKVGVMNDNRPYNALYVPVVKQHLLGE